MELNENNGLTLTHEIQRYRLILHTNLVSVILTVTFSVLEMLTRRSTVRNKMILADGNAMVYDKKAVGKHFRTILPHREHNPLLDWTKG